MIYLRSLASWLADIYLGPKCPIGCGYRGRGPRTMGTHIDRYHADGL